jgi:peptidyl-tRNA hydrolase
MQFRQEHEEIATEWYEKSNYLAVLGAADEQALLNIIDKASRKGIEFSIFFEPDLKYEITAIALAPGKDAKKICSGLKLAT